MGFKVTPTIASSDLYLNERSLELDLDLLGCGLAGYGYPWSARVRSKLPFRE